ncbi:MAG: cyclic nucleotide-binding domain-containing protein [Acidimicrobiales bacterium]
MFRRIDPIPQTLRQSPLAGAVPAKELRAIERRGTAVRFGAGRHAMREDEVGRECMIVATGSFAVERDGDGVAVLRPGMVMGEVALLTGKPRNATVTALEDSLVYAYNRREFTSLLRECPQLAAIVRADVDERSPAA